MTALSYMHNRLPHLVVRRRRIACHGIGRRR
jgi:hypothetical protein